MTAPDRIQPIVEPDTHAGPSPEDAWLLRRLRRTVRRRLRVDLAALERRSALVSDGELRVVLTAVSMRDPRTVAWRADRPVELVVLHDGCGVRALGVGGIDGVIELPAAPCPQAYLAFCYDAARGASSDAVAGPAVSRP